MMAGKMDRRIEIQRATFTADPKSGEEIPSWSFERSPWADVMPVSETENFSEEQRQAEINLTFRVRYFDGLSPKTHRVVYRGRNFDIKGSREVGRREGLDITAFARAE